MATSTAKPDGDKPTTTTTSTPPTAGHLLPASESSDPAVHQLLAERQTAVLNDDEDGVKAADDGLAELGYR